MVVLPGIRLLLAVSVVSLFYRECVSGLELLPLKQQVGRREALAGVSAVVSTTLTASPGNCKAEELIVKEAETDDFQAYSIIPDASASLNPELIKVDKSSFYKTISGVNDKQFHGGALWLGEHHNSVKDHTLQTNFIESIYKERNSGASYLPMAIGLEQVQIQFQYALDDYVSGEISLDEMKRQVQWETRWIWPFDGYAPIFEKARELKIPLIALNVNSEDLAEVEKGGLAGLPQNRLKQYIKDPRGFASFAQRKEFRDYVAYVIAPSYDLHQQMGLLQSTISGAQLEEPMSFRNFFSGRILWDESMASNAHSWVQANPGGLIIGLVGADHVKFVNGIPGRFSQMAETGLVGSEGVSSSPQFFCKSVLLNPTLIDTRPSGSVANIAEAASSQFPDRITLQLRYLKDGVDPQSTATRSLPESTGGVLPLADYIVVG